MRFCSLLDVLPQHSRVRHRSGEQVSLSERRRALLAWRRPLATKRLRQRNQSGLWKLRIISAALSPRVLTKRTLCRF